MGEPLDALLPDVVQHSGGCVDGHIVPLQELVLDRHDGALYAENLQKACQGLLDVYYVDSVALGDKVGEDNAPVIKEDEHHLL